MLKHPPHVALSDYSEGLFELSKVDLSCTQGQADEFPAIQKLNLNVDVQKLIQDFEFCKQALSDNYLEERRHGFSIPLNQVKEILTTFGFNQNYSAIGLMKVGTTELHEYVPEYTRSLLEELQPLCRAHYVIARPGLKIPKHSDCVDFSTHGFRVHIPIQNTSSYVFYQGSNATRYQLPPGSAWFFNNALTHEVSHESESVRISILLQMMSDRALLSRFA